MYRCIKRPMAGDCYKPTCTSLLQANRKKGLPCLTSFTEDFSLVKLKKQKGIRPENSERWTENGINACMHTIEIMDNYDYEHLLFEKDFCRVNYYHYHSHDDFQEQLWLFRMPHHSHLSVCSCHCCQQTNACWDILYAHKYVHGLLLCFFFVRGNPE